jgi:hypothetical protein
MKNPILRLLDKMWLRHPASGSTLMPRRTSNTRLEASSTWGFRSAVPIWALAFVTLGHAGPITWEAPRQTVRAPAGESSAEIVFRFRNDGTTPVTFGPITPGCGCTVAQLEQKTWQPGEAGELVAHARIDSRDSSKSVAVSVAYASPATEADSLNFTVESRPWFELNPRLLWWRRGGNDDEKALTVSFADGFGDSRVEIVDGEPTGFRISRTPGHAGAVSLAITPTDSASVRTRKLHLRLVRPDGRVADHTIFLRVM